MKVLEAKYRTLFGLGLKRVSEYKVNFFGRFARIPVELAIFYFLWKVIFAARGATELGGMAFPTFIVYVMMTRFVFISMPNMSITWAVEDIIASGQLSYLLTKPVSFIRYMFFRYTPEFFLYGFTATALFIGVSAAIQWHVLANPIFWALFIISLILSIALNYTLFFSIATLTFWFDGIWGVTRSVQVMRSFLSGELIPLTLFPPALATVAAVLPFKYLMFTTIFTYLEMYTVNEAILQIGIQLAWIAVFVVITNVALAAGLKKFNSQGG